MNSFGLGLVLNFVDNASSGMGNASRTFQQMSATADSMSNSVNNSVTSIVAASYALDSVGTVFLSTGNSIMNVFKGLGSTVAKVGSDFENTRMTLTALYKDADIAESKVKWLLDFAASTPFEIPSLKATMTGLKAIGVEADQVVTSVGGYSQTLMGFVGDLAALRPDIPMERLAMSIRNALGGNVRSLDMVLDIPVNEVLGRKFGESGDAAQDIADLVSNLGAEGLMKNLEGTWGQMISNLGDQWTRFSLILGDVGMFDMFKNTLKSFYDSVTSLTEGQMTSVANTVKGAMEIIWKPIDKVVSMVSKAIPVFVKWTETHPRVAKGILLITAALGGLLAAGGLFLKFMSMVGLASVGLSYLKGLPTLLKVVGAGFKGAIASALPLVALAGVLYYAWSNNLFGIRDAFQKTFGELGEIVSLVSDAWKDNTLSYDMFQKAKDLGVLPLIESLLQLKYYWGYLKEGFKEGFKAFFDGISNSLEGLKVMGIDIKGIARSMGTFMKGLVEIGAEDKWTRIGNAFGKIAASFLVIAAASNAIKGVGLVFKGMTSVLGGFGVLGNVLKGIGGVMKTVFGPLMGFLRNFGAALSLLREGASVASVLGAAFPKLAAAGQAVMGVLTAIAGALGISVGWVVAIIAAVVAVGILIAKNWDKVKAILSSVGSWIMTNVLIPVRNFFATALNFIVGLVVTAWEWAKGILAPVGAWISANIIGPAKSLFKGLWDKIVSIVTGIYNSICDTLRPVGEWVSSNVIEPTKEFFSGLWTSIKEVFGNIYDSITEKFKSAYDFVVELWSGISDFFSGIWEKISGWTSDIVEKGETVTGVESKVSAEKGGKKKKKKKKVPAAANGVENFVGGLIQVNEKGGELINLPTGSTVIPHDDSIKEAFNMGAKNSLALLANRNSAPTSSTTEKNDYSVTFSAGSVVIQVANATDAELERAAEKLMKIIERKQQLKRMAVRA